MRPGADIHHRSVAVREAAAGWFARQQGHTLSRTEQAEFAHWLSQDVGHEAEYQSLERLWSATDVLPKARLLALCEEPPARAGRRSLLRYAVAASVLALVGAGGWWQWQSLQPYSAEFATALGERRQLSLPDGSSIELNSRSRVRVSFSGEQRRVLLEQGEALFSVAHDRERPFVVEAGAGRVTVTGTRFDVRRDGEQARVAVESGHVQVQGRDAQHGISLTAGLGTLVDAQGRVGPAQAVNTQALTAWRNGQLVFDNATLGEVAEEVSRYRQQPLHVSTPELAQLRLSSVFKIDDSDALLKALPQILPVAIQTRNDGSQEIIAR